MRKGYTFDDIALVPQFNNIPSRTHPNLESWLTRSRKIAIPLLASNMESVINEELATCLIEEGSLPIFHRYASYEKQKEWVEKFGGRCFLSVGLQDLEQVHRLVHLGPGGLCIDVAHGHSDRMCHFIEAIKKEYPNLDLIAGNVCTSMAYHDLVNAGADAVKVGIGPGAACTTRRVTGFGLPQFTAIRECASVANKLRIPMIADGGIKSSREMILALAAGASSVMCGQLFAAAQESNAPKRVEEGIAFANYRGQASTSFQEEVYGGVKEKTVAEGVECWIPITGSAKEVINRLLGGLRSGMTYGGARNLKELQRKAEFVEVTVTYRGEGGSLKIPN